MTNCRPACTVPSSTSSPVVGFGSAGSCGLGSGGLGYGYGGLGYREIGYGDSASALADTSGLLCTLAGAFPSCINQTPPSEFVFMLSPFLVTLPVPILSASCEPVTVEGNTPYAINGSGIIASRGLWGPGLWDGPLGKCFGGCGKPSLPC